MQVADDTPMTALKMADKMGFDNALTLLLLGMACLVIATGSVRNMNKLWQQWERLVGSHGGSYHDPQLKLVKQELSPQVKRLEHKKRKKRLRDEQRLRA